ncbi:hypothetical protein OsJ_31907 [Oryza sativa Japonica Group]|uniref:Uncharacterized protein n=2 Tax=Oryza sativa subsp. japonica TaxID=39947 RepID=A0A8J8Y1T8_ORYSJ|nr:hypothetical protein LOC_Os10g33886 [Oryza sativa Japonica Group]EAZ16438.1 hypothetical protein OsJ_31907 [Oryza sativa Japonica Group]
MKNAGSREGKREDENLPVSEGKGGSRIMGQVLHRLTGTHTACFGFHQWRPGGTDVSIAGCRCWRKPRQERMAEEER